MNYNFNYLGSEYNWLFYLAILSITQHIVMSLLVRKDAVSDVKTSIHTVMAMEVSHPGFKRYISYIHDNFYWFFNVFPILYFVHFFYLDYSWPGWMHSLFLLDVDGQIAALYQGFFYSNTANSVDWIIFIITVIIFPTVAYKSQDKKHTQQLKQKSELYWWSKELNPSIYALRKIFLYFNIALISFLTYLITKISIFVGLVLSLDTLNIFPFHVDGYGGLHFMMEITSILISMYLLRASMGIIGLDDHKGQGFMHQLTDWLNIIYLPVAIALFGTIIYQTKQHLNFAREKYDIDKYLSPDIYNAYIEKFKVATDKSAMLNDFSDYYDILRNSAFPIDISMYYNTAFTAVMPISLWFLMSNFKEQIAGEIEDNYKIENKKS